MFRHILVPTDFTARSRRAADIAGELAAAGRAKVTLLHVVERIEGLRPGELATFYRDLERRAREKMPPFAARLERAGLAPKTKVVTGNRVDEILRCAVAGGADLIVLGSHKVDLGNPGRGWGTISYKVGILSPCPVLLVK